MSNSIVTYTGTRVHYPFVNPQEIIIADIAHALSNQCRFTGHLHEYWSVAQHSLCVAALVPDEHKKQALLHDAPEAYLCDIPTPFKRMMPEYMRMEAEMWALISERFDVGADLHPAVLEADKIMLMTERDAFNPNNRGWEEHYENTRRAPDLLEIYRGLDAATVEQLFLDKFKECCGV